MSGTNDSPQCFDGLEKGLKIAQYGVILLNIKEKITCRYYSPRWNPALPERGY